MKEICTFSLLIVVDTVLSQFCGVGKFKMKEICKIYIKPLHKLEFMVKDRKRRPEGGEWEPQISFEMFSHCPKITAKRKHNPKLKYSSETVTRVSRKILRNGRKLTKQTEHESELKRPNYERNKKSWLGKFDRKSPKIDHQITKKKGQRPSALGAARLHS